MKTLLTLIRFSLILFFTLGPTAGQGEERLLVTAVGDIMMGSTGRKGRLPPEDGRDLFREILPYLRQGDIVFGNLEGPLYDGNEPGKCADSASPFCFEFKTPTRYGRYLQEAGFTALSIANNHTLDYGTPGLKSTVATLGALGIMPVGGPYVGRVTVKGKRVGLIGFSHLDHAASWSLLEIDRARERIAAVKRTCDLLIVSFHGGAEGREALRVTEGTEYFLGENVVWFSRAAVEAGADLVIGHGPHVLRAMEIYQGKLIAYSLGNFLTYGSFNLKGPNRISVVLQVYLSLADGKFSEGRLLPIQLVGEGRPVPDPTQEAVKLMRTLMEKEERLFFVLITEEGEIQRRP